MCWQLRVFTGIAFSTFLCLVASVRLLAETDQPMQTKHASLAAYPQAVVTLKDTNSESLFYVETNGRTLICFDKDGRIKWSVDVLATVTPNRGSPVVRHLSLKDGKLSATCGRSTWATVNLDTGKVEFAGND